jgi:AcrR family transcriptional regulator
MRHRKGRRTYRATVPARRRLPPDERRQELVEVGARLFARSPYDDVTMDEVAGTGGVSRALLYRYFPSKRDLFAAVYQQAADRLLAVSTFDPDAPVADQLAAGLDAHLDYFVAHRLTVLAANRVLAGDPTIQAIISDEMAELRRRLLETMAVEGASRELVASVIMSWLVFVRTLCVDWLTTPTCSRTEIREACLGALVGALDRLSSAPLTAPHGRDRRPPAES